MNELEFKNYKNRFNLHHLATDKFKTNLIQIHFLLPLSTKREAAMNALLPLILKRGTKNYSSSQLIKIELEKLYGSNINFNILKRGENQILRFSLEMVNEKYLKEKKNLNENAFNLLSDILFNPLTEGDFFKEKYFQQEKNNLQQEILSLINNKYSYAVQNCINKMCADEKYGIYKLGSTAVLNDFSNRDLYQHYQNLIKKANRSVFFLGDFEKKFLEKVTTNNKLFSSNDLIDSNTEVVYKDKEVDFYQEQLSVNQAKLSLGFRTGITRKMDAYYALLVFNNLLSGSTHSLLFQEIRENRSLAYYINSSIETTKGLLLINSGIDAKNYQKVIDLVKKAVIEAAAGNFGREEFERAKKSVINKLKQDLDSNRALSAHYLLAILNDKKESINQIIKKVEDLLPEDIMAAAEKLKLDTIYLLKSGD